MNNAITITQLNGKGGVGKTVNTTMLSYHLAKKGYKTLVLDLDPQANSTKILFKTKLYETKKMPTIETSFMKTIVENTDIRKCVHEITDNLYVIPNAVDFSVYIDYLNEKYKSTKDKVFHLDNLIQPLRSEFDFIMIDVPPTISKYTDNAVIASDYVNIILQTEEFSLDGATDFISYMQDLIDEYEIDVDILGVIPVLHKNNSKVDESILEYATERFDQSNMYTNVVKRMERIKRFTMDGIKDNDLHDKRVHAVYKKLTNEFLDRLGINVKAGV